MAENFIGSTAVSNPNFNIRQEQDSAKFKKQVNRSLIDSAYPAPAAPQPAHLGSQSVSPTRMDTEQ